MTARPDLARACGQRGNRRLALVFAGCGAIVTDTVHGGTLGAVGVSPASAW